MKKLPPSCEAQLLVDTLSTSLSLCTRRVSRRELLLPPNTCATRSSRSLWRSPACGTFHILRTITCGTLSSSSVRPFFSSGAMSTFGWAMVGEAGMSPKYFATFCRAVATSMSPASTSTALLGPYQARNHCFTSASDAALRSFIEPMVVWLYGWLCGYILSDTTSRSWP